MFIWNNYIVTTFISTCNLIAWPTRENCSMAAVDLGPFQQGTVIDQLLEAGRGHEVIVDAVDFTRARRPSGGRNAENQLRNPLPQAADQRRFSYRGWTGQHHHASCGLACSRGPKTLVAVTVRSPVGAHRLSWGLPTSIAQLLLRPFGLHRRWAKRSRTFPAEPCADDRRAHAGGGSGRFRARS
jgi:hypothetical protein